MSFKLFLSQVLLFLSASVVSQNTVALIDKVVAGMKEDVGAYHKEEIINSEEGYRWIYYKDQEPLVIEVQERARILKKVCWYFYQEKLIYTETNWTDSLDGKTIHREKTYHYQEAMIAWLDNENTFVNANSAEYNSLDKALTEYSQKIYREALKDSDK